MSEVNRIYVGPWDDLTLGRKEGLSFPPGDPAAGASTYRVVNTNPETDSLWVHTVRGLEEQEFHVLERLLLVLSRTPSILRGINWQDVERFVSILDRVVVIAQDGFNLVEDVPHVIGLISEIRELLK